jgi:hypothetical protein
VRKAVLTRGRIQWIHGSILYWVTCSAIFWSGLVAGWLCALVVGMRAAMLPVSSYEAAALGSVCGLIAIVIVWVLNNSVRGIRSVPEEN